MYLSIALQPPRDRSCFIIWRATIGPVNMAHLGCVLVGESKRTPFHRSAPGIVIPISAASEVECLQLKQLWSLGPIPIKMHKKSGTRPCLLRSGSPRRRSRPACGMTAAKSPYTSVTALACISLQSSVIRHLMASCCVRQPSPANDNVIHYIPRSSNALADHVGACWARHAQVKRSCLRKLLIAKVGITIGPSRYPCSAEPINVHPGRSPHVVCWE